jgi:hypothetical protein
MFLSDKNKELLLELIQGLPGEMTPEQIDELMRQFPTDDSKPLLETNKLFLLFYLQSVNDSETIKLNPPKIETVTPSISMETLMMEISFIKQELIEVKKMMLITTQLIQQNSSVAQNSDGN